MKIVKAKCPSCGEKIDVDEYSDKTRCEFCKESVNVSEAIEKLEVENNKEVKLNNSKVDNLFKNADRSYRNNEFGKAYDLFSKVLDLDPDNQEAILKKGFCKFLDSDFSKSDINVVLNSIIDVYELLDESNYDKLFDYIEETYRIVSKYERIINKIFDSKLLLLDEVKNNQLKFVSCLKVYDYLYNISKDDEQKLKIANKIIDTCDSVNESRKYDTGKLVKGEKLVKDYYSSFPNVKSMKNDYNKILFGVEDDVKEEKTLEKNSVLDNNKSNNNDFSLKLMYYLVYCLGVFLIILSFVMYLKRSSSLMDTIVSWLFGIGIVIINLPNVSNRLFKVDRYKYILVLILFIIWLVFLFSKYIIG